MAGAVEKMKLGVRETLIVAALALVSAAFLISYWSVPVPPPQSITINCERDPAMIPSRGQAGEGKTLDYLHTCGKKIYNSEGREVRITGINWFGMETETFAPHGLWARNWESLLDRIAELGFNAIRLPYSNEMLIPGQMPAGIDYEQNADLKGLTSLEVMDKLIEGARERGLRVILDRHRPTSAGQSPLWYTDDVSEEQWILDWQMLALRYANNDTVIGVDLHNEPKWEATWGTGDLKTDWRLAAERAGNAVLEVNPYLLIFVQGVEVYRNDWYWWGGNLIGVARDPVRFKVPNRVVYSPHDYGPEVFMQGWFSDPSFPGNLPDVWGKHWGFIHEKNMAPVVLGEFGGRSVGEDAGGQWHRSLVEYLTDKGIGYINWSFNPNSADTGGLLGEDWATIVEEKQNLYSGSLAPPIAEGVIGVPEAKLKLLYRNNNVDEETNTVSITFRIQNDGALPLDLSKVQIRYWFIAGDQRGADQLVDVDFAAIGRDHIKPRIEKTTKGGQDSSLVISFDTVLLRPYSDSGEILLRIHKPDWSDYNQRSSYSFSSSTEFAEREWVTGYVDGQLVWGMEP